MSFSSKLASIFPRKDLGSLGLVHLHAHHLEALPLQKQCDKLSPKGWPNQKGIVSGTPSPFQHHPVALQVHHQIEGHLVGVVAEEGHDVLAGQDAADVVEGGVLCLQGHGLGRR